MDKIAFLLGVIKGAQLNHY